MKQEQPVWPRILKAAIVDGLTITLISALLILLVGAVDRFESHGKPSKQVLSEGELAVGTQFNPNTIALKAHQVSLIVMTSPTCPYCLASISFHKTLIKESQPKNIPVYFAVPARDNAAQYLKNFTLADSAILQWKTLNVRPAGTPTIAAVDAHGTVRKLWLGKLSAEHETEIVNTIRTNSILESDSSVFAETPNLTSDDLRKPQAGVKQPSIIETRERDAKNIRKDAVIIPLLELATRAPLELDKQSLQVVDCANLVRSQCGLAVSKLRDAGFRVATLDAGDYSKSCDATAVH